MAISDKIKASVLMVVATSCASAQALNWDFEDDAFRGWTQTGKGFSGQPFCKRAQDAEMPS